MAVPLHDRWHGSIRASLDALRAAGVHKDARVLTSAQGARVVVDGRDVVNFCANNYLGLANHPEVVAAAHQALATHGWGMASVRFICGTQDLHTQLEERLAALLGQEAAILYTSCFDANGGLFETLLDAEDMVLSDALNHASIIDGIRLCKAHRHRYAHADMADLERRLRDSQHCRHRLVATDGVFSMDGSMAPLGDICALAKRYGAWVMVDDSHATGIVGPDGRGTPAHHGVAVDIVTSTLGKALGGATGGFTAARADVVELLRQRSRPYLFSNSLPPVVVAAALRALDLLRDTPELRARLWANTRYFRQRLREAGFSVAPGEHPIVPIMLGDEKLAHAMPRELFEAGIYVVGFSHPVVPHGEARIRVQISAAHERADLDHAVGAFARIGQRHGIV